MANLILNNYCIKFKYFLQIIIKTFLEASFSQFKVKMSNRQVR